MDLVPWLLFAHILGAIVAFGPTFAFPMIGAAGGREPQHVNFALRISRTIAERLVWPLALLQGVTGFALVLALELDLLATESRWLLAGIALYAAALAMSYFVVLPNVRRLIEITSSPPPPGSSGPPPELLARVAAGRRNGLIQLVLVIAIVALMVLKPTF